MRKGYKYLRSRGSITIEACVVLPVFLSIFFLLLFLVRFTCTGMALDHAVNETAKEIAAGAYPISFINEIEDEKLEQYENAEIPTLEEELEKLVQQSGTISPGNILSILMSEDFKGEDISQALKGVLEDYSKGIIGGIVDKITPVYWDMKSAGKYMIAEALIKELLDSSLVNTQSVKLRLVEFPQSKAEYAAKAEIEAYKSYGLTPDKDFSHDDVVIQLEYCYKVKLPFMKALDFKMIHTAVERAWINGSFGILTAEDEGLELEPEGNTVFITRTGIRYHKGSCRYLRKSRIPIDVGEAVEKGYTPCKVCKPQI